MHFSVIKDISLTLVSFSYVIAHILVTLRVFGIVIYSEFYTRVLHS